MGVSYAALVLVLNWPWRATEHTFADVPEARPGRGPADARTRGDRVRTHARRGASAGADWS